MNRAVRSRWIAAAIALLADPTAAIAQTVTGKVTERAVGAPLRGAFVMLLDANGGRVQGVLTNSTGDFTLRAQPGRYSLRADLIGHQTATLPSFDLVANQTKTVVLSLEIAALRLGEISVRGERRCEGRPDANRQTALVWAEARKALEVNAWLKGSGMAVFHVRSHEVDLDRELNATRAPVYKFTSNAGQQAFRALNPDTLARYGFVRSIYGETYLYGPDAEVLLSNSFLNTHCFQLVRRNDRPGMIGLAFQPTRDRSRIPEITGTLWLDNATAGLRFIEYGYTNINNYDDRRYAGGRTEFERLPNGAWIVRRWHVRGPRLRQAGTQVSVVGAHEEGAEVLDATVGTGVNVQLAPRITLRGTVFDSVAGIGLRDARVYLSGTPFTTTSGRDGQFVFDSVPAGDYEIAFEHRRLDSLPMYPLPRRLTVDSTTAPVQLAIPSVLGMIGSRCSAEDLAAAVRMTRDTTATRGGMIFGTVTGELGPLANAEVSVSWQRITAAGDGRLATLDQIQARPLHFTVETDEDGHYTLCGVEPERILTVKVTNGGRLLQSDTARINWIGLRRYDIDVRRR